MRSLYNLSIHVYLLLIRILSPFNHKAKWWIEGRKNILERIREALGDEPRDDSRMIAWFHCASLGEFEQGRPVIERFRERFPGYKIFLTFFSPSGYEVRKNYKGADYIFYLPADTIGNAEEFITVVNPRMAFFIKYEYWYNYLGKLHEKGIPIYMVSAIFRPDQHFFRFYGGWFLEQLRTVTWFFLQDPESAKLLLKAGISHFMITGDTRFDRVNEITRHLHAFPLIERFCENSQVILCGSTWSEDEEVLIPLLEKSGHELKYIIAPHETHNARIISLESRLKIPALKFSEAGPRNIDDYRILIIDSIGILAHLYQYAFLAYIGGGFGSGIHNILEAATFGIPVVFGPNYRKFREANDLIGLGGAFTVTNANQFIQITDQLLTDPGKYARSGEICLKYVKEHTGATDKILEKING